MRNALTTVFPQTQLRSCWFHFCQAVKRHASQIEGFLIAARKNTETAKVYYQMLCLPLLPAQHILEVFKMLRMEAKTIHGNLFDKFMDYVEHQWMKKVLLLLSIIIDSDCLQNCLFLFYYFRRKGQQKYPCTTLKHVQQLHWKRIIAL